MTEATLRREPRYCEFTLIEKDGERKIALDLNRIACWSGFPGDNTKCSIWLEGNNREYIVSESYESVGDKIRNFIGSF